LVYVSLPQQWARIPHIRQLLAKIPNDASVSATTYLIPHLSSRRAVIRLTGLEFKNDRDEITKVDYVIADLWQLQKYKTAFKEDRRALTDIVTLINNVTSDREYGIIGFNNGVILLAKEATSQPEAFSAWNKYLNTIEDKPAQLENETSI
jgi:hypothetical protein